jgi:hypothetical protein
MKLLCLDATGGLDLGNIILANPALVWMRGKEIAVPDKNGNPPTDVRLIPVWRYFQYERRK